MWNLNCHYDTVKYVSIKDSRLGILRTVLLILIVIYVSTFELWAQGGYLEQVPIVGVVHFSLQQPTVGGCDPTSTQECENAIIPLDQLQYCQQGSNNNMKYNGTVYPCEIYEATNAQIVSEKSISIITRASTRKQALVCHERDMVCKRTYNDTSLEWKFYTAQVEAFTILFDHAVTASKICSTKYNHYACSSEAAQHEGRLYSLNSKLCASEYSKGNAYHSFRGGGLSYSAPCYIKPNATTSNKDFFSLDVLLQASNGISLDSCNTLVDQKAPVRDEEQQCKTYRETGGTILLNVYWSDFRPFHGRVTPYYYYTTQFLAGSPFQQTVPYYEAFRSSRTLLKAHGIRVAVLFQGNYHQFNLVNFLITVTTALGLLAVATTIVDTFMLYILPEKKRYQEAKFEEEGRNNDTEHLVPEQGQGSEGLNEESANGTTTLNSLTESLL